MDLTAPSMGINLNIRHLTILSVRKPGTTILSVKTPGTTILSVLTPGTTILSVKTPGTTILSVKYPVSEYWAPLGEGFWGLGFSSIVIMGAVSCYIEHVITFEFVSEFAFVSAFVSCCIRFFHLPARA